ncbi:hypothetical protein [Chryseobacterium sp. G0201]|uniref:hypothetical protein n=1 Tax=Chryseobacterium sp. G0201 TaxID=2487065 RepID=UPI000F4D33DF|nr:hypothetical protein [Chryseobacterium sp. G0201]AZA53160.1 hypothetical protein EG348_09095 [Chryseobacterium sp. G0201]
MKKVKLSALLLAAILGNVNTLKAQDGFTNKYINFLKPTPEVGKLISSIDFPVSQTSGALDLKLPLYTIKTKSVDIPITLSYKNSGFQVNEESSNVGFGWDLDVGGRIYRQVRGYVDYQQGFREFRQSGNRVLFPECPDVDYNSPTVQDACNMDYKYMFGIFGNPSINYGFDGNHYNYQGMGIPLPGGNGIWPFQSANTVYQDAESEADIFYYKYPNGSGKFFHGDLFQIKSIPFTKEKITENTITDTQGNTFYFNDRADEITQSLSNTIKYFSAGSPVPSNGPRSNNYSYSLLLSKITTNSNDVIDFTYSTVEYIKYGPKVWKIRRSVNTIPNSGNFNFTPITNGYFDNEETSQQKIKTKKIESISLNNKVIARFIYSDLPRNDLYYETTNAPKSLSKILILDESGRTINTINFHQSYFGQNSTTQSSLQEVSKYLRLRLDSFENNDASYKFGYFNSVDNILPNKSIQDSKDHWGFYNGKPAHYGHLMGKSQLIEEIGNSYKYPDLEKTKLTVLKEVTFPTGGNEQYGYELNTVNSGNVGGLRIASITKNDSNGGSIKKNITYDNGYLYTDPQYVTFEATNAYPQSTPFLPKPLLYRFNVFSSTSINDLMGFNGFPVYYSKITEENVNPTNENLGKTVTEYSYFEDVIGDTGYTPAYYMTNISYDWKRNLPLKVSYFRANETAPYKKITNHYTFLDTPIDISDAMYPGPGGGFPTLLKQNESQYTSYKLFVQKLQTTINNQTGIWMSGIPANELKAEFEFSFSRLISAQFFKDKETVEETIDGNLLTTSTDYKYDNPINAQLTSEITTFPDNSTQEKIYKYAHEKGIQKLIDANMISVPLETEIKKDSKVISIIEQKYDNPAHLFPTSVLTNDIQNNATITELTFNKYDSKGKLQQYTTKDGVPISIIWGYNNTEPIAKIEGAKLSDIQQSFIDSIVNASNTDALAAPNNDEASFLSTLNTFKNNLPNYQVTTYTYDPLIGVRSITPPSGIREVYIYDNANRLKEIRENDATGKLLKEFKYNYKN